MKTRINEEIKKALENFSNGEKERKLQNYKDLNKYIIKDQMLFRLITNGAFSYYGASSM